MTFNWKDNSRSKKKVFSNEASDTRIVNEGGENPLYTGHENNFGEICTFEDLW